MSADSKTCYHCDRVLPHKIDPLDPFGGVHGICNNCAIWKFNWYEELKQRTCSAPARHEK